MFARSDLSHLHAFELPDARSVAHPDDEMELEDQEQLRAVDAIRPGDVFTYTFDWGDEWIHSCIADTGFDPRTDWGEVPTDVVPIFGWGAIPDQYGREEEDRPPGLR